MHLAAARVRARRADERRDRARRVVAHLGDGGVDREPLLREPEVASRDRRDHGDLVVGLQRLRRLHVRPVPRVEKPCRLVAEPEQRPHVGDRRAVGDVDVERPGARSLAERGEQSDAHVHANEGIRRLPRGP